MAKLISTLFISADGVAEIDPDWHFPYFDQNMGRAVGEDYDTSDVLLIGRETYDSFAGAWPDRENAGEADAALAKQLGDMRKVVVSRQPLQFSWRNSELVDGDLVGAVTALKADPGVKGILIPGSISVVQQLLAAGLVDELRLLVHPVAARKGHEALRRRRHALPPHRDGGGDVPDRRDPRDLRAVRGARQGRLRRRQGPGTQLEASPDVLGDLRDQAQLVDLLVRVEHVALHRGGEPALGREAELVERHVASGFVDAALELVGVFHAPALGGDQPEHDPLACRHETQRGEAARAFVVELAEEGVDVQRPPNSSSAT